MSVAVTVIKLSPAWSGASAEKFPRASSRAVTPWTTTCLTPESSSARPKTVILVAVDWTPTPLVTGGEVMTIFGAVVSLIGGLAGPVVPGGSADFLIAAVFEASGRLPPAAPGEVTTATFSPLNPAATRSGLLKRDMNSVPGDSSASKRLKPERQ